MLFIVYDAFLDQPASDTMKNEKSNNLKIFGINEAKGPESDKYYMDLSCFD
jgi:hypothetical protein